MKWTDCDSLISELLSLKPIKLCDIVLVKDVVMTLGWVEIIILYYYIIFKTVIMAKCY